MFIVGSKGRGEKEFTVRLEESASACSALTLRLATVTAEVTELKRSAGVSLAKEADLNAALEMSSATAAVIAKEVAVGRFGYYPRLLCNRFSYIITVSLLFYNCVSSLLLYTNCYIHVSLLLFFSVLFYNYCFSSLFFYNYCFSSPINAQFIEHMFVV